MAEVFDRLGFLRGLVVGPVEQGFIFDRGLGGFARATARHCRIPSIGTFGANSNEAGDEVFGDPGIVRVDLSTGLVSSTMLDLIVTMNQDLVQLLLNRDRLP